MKKVALTLAGLLLIACSSAYAQDKGPADIMMQTEAAKKPATFPHAQHQAAIGCGECHHSMVDGQKVPFKEGDTVGKCTSCHNGDVLAGKAVTLEGFKKPLKLDTYKGAGHAKCFACHKAMAKKDPALKEKKIDKCGACHPKK